MSRGDRLPALQKQKKKKNYPGACIEVRIDRWRATSIRALPGRVPGVFSGETWEGVGSSELSEAAASSPGVRVNRRGAVNGLAGFKFHECADQSNLWDPDQVVRGKRKKEDSQMQLHAGQPENAMQVRRTLVRIVCRYLHVGGSRALTPAACCVSTSVPQLDVAVIRFLPDDRTRHHHRASILTFFRCCFFSIS